MKTSKKLSTGVSIGTVYVVNVVIVVVIVNVVVVVIAEVDKFTFHKKKAKSCFSAATAKSTFLKNKYREFFLS